MNDLVGLDGLDYYYQGHLISLHPFFADWIVCC